MDPWDEGYDAGMSGYVYDDNPYEEDTQDYRDWSYGRFCAEEDKEREEDDRLYYAELQKKKEEANN